VTRHTIIAQLTAAAERDDISDEMAALLSHAVDYLIRQPRIVERRIRYHACGWEVRLPDGTWIPVREAHGEEHLVWDAFTTAVADSNRAVNGAAVRVVVELLP